MRVLDISVGPDRVGVRLAFESGEPTRASECPGLADLVLSAFPGMGGHRCSTQSVRAFADELADTELAHLFEHVVLELMASAGSPRDLGGHTSWDFRVDGPRVYRVSLEYDDDLVCLGAIKAADRILRCMIQHGDSPDVKAEARRLESLRDRPAGSGQAR